MYNIFISSRQNETKDLRSLAFRPCIRNGVDPFLFEWDVAPAEEIVEYLTKRISDRHLFVGIYKKEYGQREVPLPGSGELVSPIEFELRTAIQHMGRENVMLFVQKGHQREADLESMLAGKVYKEFESENEFSLLLDETIKSWKGLQEDKKRPIVPDSKVVSVSVDCRDRSGILATIYRTLFTQGGNVLYSRQTAHLGLATTRVIVQWEQRAEYPQEDALRAALSQNLATLLGVDTYKEISISSIPSNEGLIQAKGFFKIELFDGPGIAERIFAVFAKDSVSIIESQLDQVSTAPPIARFSIVTNATNMTSEMVNITATKLKSLAGIFRVDAYVKFGEWWY